MKYTRFDTKNYYTEVEGGVTTRIFGLSVEWYYYPDKVVIDEEAGATIRVPKEFSIDLNFPFSWLRVSVRKKYEVR